MPRLADATRIERRRALIDAAYRCVGDRGFASLTVDDVCAEAGVSKGSFYVYFGHKQELLRALLDDEAAEMDRLIRDLDAARLSAVGRLRRFTRAMLDRGEVPAHLQIRADLWAEMSTDPTVRDAWASIVAARRASLKGWIDDGIASGEIAPIPSNALAAILVALGDGLLLHAGLDRDAFRLANARKALDAILGGLQRGAG